MLRRSALPPRTWLPRGLSRCRPLHSPPPDRTSPEVISLLDTYSRLPPRPVPLSTLLSFGSPLSPESLLDSASYVLHELPRRLVHRVHSFDSLPYIVGTNPFIARTRQQYRSSFIALASQSSVDTLEDNWAFSQKLEELVKIHANDIPAMAKGFLESTRYMAPADISKFLDAAIQSRIAIRLIAEQHISLSRALRDPSSVSHNIGVVNPNCSPAEVIRMCASFVGELCEATLGSRPELIVEGVKDATFPYVSVHLEYILTEIFKNAFRATVEHHRAQKSTGPLPPITITISPSPCFLSLRVRDEGGGVPRNNMERIFSYAFTTAGRSAKGDSNDDDGGPYAAQHIGGSAALGTGLDSMESGDGGLFGEITGKALQTGLGTIAGLGYGLPLARRYASYFGGSLELVSLYGHGADVFIKLRSLDRGADVEI